MAVRRIGPEEAMALETPLLVCAYEDEERCREIAIDGSITIRELRSRLPRLPQGEHVVLY